MMTSIGQLALLITVSALLAGSSNAKALNQNQVKFRRLPPKEFSASLGSSITIECEAGASPPPTIHWLKNGKRIIQDESLEENLVDEPQTSERLDEQKRIALSSTRSRLFIDCAQYHDEAIYTCVAENAFSRISSHTKLELLERRLASSGEQPSLAEPDVEPKSLEAIPTCLASSGSSEPLRIHMWTHNIVEIMKNDIILYCRSNLKRMNQQQQQKATISWQLPDEKLVGAEHKDKFQVLDSGDLLIKDLKWADMGSYICTVSDKLSSDSISAFVYPASVKPISKRNTLSPRPTVFR